MFFNLPVLKYIVLPYTRLCDQPWNYRHMYKSKTNPSKTLLYRSSIDLELTSHIGNDIMMIVHYSPRTRCMLTTLSSQLFVITKVFLQDWGCAARAFAVTINCWKMTHRGDHLAWKLLLTYTFGFKRNVCFKSRMQAIAFRNFDLRIAMYVW